MIISHDLFAAGILFFNKAGYWIGGHYLMDERIVMIFSASQMFIRFPLWRSQHIGSSSHLCPIMHHKNNNGIECKVCYLHHSECHLNQQMCHNRQNACCMWHRHVHALWTQNEPDFGTKTWIFSVPTELRSKISRFSRFLSSPSSGSVPISVLSSNTVCIQQLSNNVKRSVPW